MKLSCLFGLFFALFSLPVLAECPTARFICSEGVMTGSGECYACDTVLPISPCNLEQAKRNCPNRFIDEFDGRSKLKCEDGLERIGNKCLEKCEKNGIRDRDGNCLYNCYEDKNGNKVCDVRFTPPEKIVYYSSPSFISNEMAKNFVCNDGVLTVSGQCVPCDSEFAISPYNFQMAKENCPKSTQTKSTKKILTS